MRHGTVIQVQDLSCTPDRDVGSNPVVRVTTTWDGDALSGFYAEPDMPHPPNGTPIAYDIQDGLLHKCVEWGGRRYRQKGFSFEPGKEFH